jgi:uncharacterized LabA/DUF88 family protein
METHNMDLLLIVDHDRRFRDTQAAGQNVIPAEEAEKIALMASAFTARMQRVAFVSEHDPDGLRAYREAGYETIQVNGNRNQVLSARIGGWRKMLAEGGHLKHLVIVSPDEQFETLMRKTKQAEGLVHLWAPAEQTPPELKKSSYDFRDIGEMLPIKAETIIFIDYENIHITLERHGFQPDPKKLITAIKTMAADLGNIVSLEAYADWKELERHSQMDIQRRLAELDVNTHYLVSQHGKNSADMRIVKDIRDALEPISGRHNLKRIMVVSGDRDFRDVICAIQEHGKEAIVMGLQGSLSADLARSANKVRYLDDELKTPVDKIVCSSTPYNANLEQINYLTSWVTARITKALEKLPYVDSHYLATGMAQDAQLQKWGLAQTQRAACDWLFFLASMGRIVHVKMSHPKTPRHNIDIWKLPGERSGFCKAHHKSSPLELSTLSAQ